MKEARILEGMDYLTKRHTFVVSALGLILGLAACSGPAGVPNEPPGSGGGEPIQTTLNADTTRGEVPFVVSFNVGAEGTGEDTTYSWNFGDGGPSEGSRSRLHVYSEPGTYPVRVLAQGDAGGDFDELAITALESTIPRNISNVPPTVALTATVVDPLKPDTVSFLAAGEDTSDDALSYLLDFGDGNRTSQASAEHVYDAPGTYLATIVVRDTHNTVAYAETRIEVGEAATSAQ